MQIPGELTSKVEVSFPFGLTGEWEDCGFGGSAAGFVTWAKFLTLSVPVSSSAKYR